MMRVVALTTLALAFTFEGRAGLIPSIEVAETMVHAQESGSMFMRGVFGVDSNSTMEFSARFDPAAKTFNYATAPGQTYQGLAFSMNTSGAFNSQSGEYDWITTANLGADTWTGTGSAVWVGDPTATINTTYRYKGDTYTVTGTIPVDSFGHSSGTLTYTHPNGSRFRWESTDFVPGTPNMPITVQANGFEAEFSLNGNLPFPNGGLGNFAVRIAPAAIPEPSTTALIIGGLIFLGSRKRIGLLRRAGRNS